MMAQSMSIKEEHQAEHQEDPHDGAAEQQAQDDEGEACEEGHARDAEAR